MSSALKFVFDLGLLQMNLIWQNFIYLTYIGEELSRKRQRQWLNFPWLLRMHNNKDNCFCFLLLRIRRTPSATVAFTMANVNEPLN